MAKCILPCGSSDTRGKVGGFEFNTNRGASIVKARTSAVGGHTAREAKCLTRLHTLQHYWLEMRPTSKRAWDHVARQHSFTNMRGVVILQTGAAVFMAISYRLLNLDLPISERPPDYWLTTTIGQMWLTQHPQGIRVDYTWNGVFPPGRTYIEIWLGGPHSAGTKYDIRHCLMLHSWAAPGPVIITNPGPSGTYTVWARLVHEMGTYTNPVQAVGTFKW